MFKRHFAIALEAGNGEREQPFANVAPTTLASEISDAEQKLNEQSRCPVSPECPLLGKVHLLLAAHPVYPPAGRSVEEGLCLPVPPMALLCPAPPLCNFPGSILSSLLFRSCSLPLSLSPFHRCRS